MCAVMRTMPCRQERGGRTCCRCWINSQLIPSRTCATLRQLRCSHPMCDSLLATLVVSSK